MSDRTAEDGQALYTLHEASLELRHRECSQRGHDFNVITTMVTGTPSGVACERCGKSWRVQSDEGKGKA